MARTLCSREARRVRGVFSHFCMRRSPQLPGAQSSASVRIGLREKEGARLVCVPMVHLCHVRAAHGALLAPSCDACLLQALCHRRQACKLANVLASEGLGCVLPSRLGQGSGDSRARSRGALSRQLKKRVGSGKPSQTRQRPFVYPSRRHGSVEPRCSEGLGRLRYIAAISLHVDDSGAQPGSGHRIALGTQQMTVGFNLEDGGLLSEAETVCPCIEPCAQQDNLPLRRARGWPGWLLQPRVDGARAHRNKIHQFLMRRHLLGRRECTQEPRGGAVDDERRDIRARVLRSSAADWEERRGRAEESASRRSHLIVSVRKYEISQFEIVHSL